MGEDSTKDLSAPVAEPEITQMHDSYMYSGIGGWLSFYIAIYLYIIPAFFVPATIIDYFKYRALAPQFPLIILFGIVSEIASIYILIMGIKAAKALKDIKPRAVQGVRVFIIKAYFLSFLTIPVSIFSQQRRGDMLSNIVLGVLMSTLGAITWTLYFRKSKRVRATYPDWQE